MTTRTALGQSGAIRLQRLEVHFGTYAIDCLILAVRINLSRPNLHRTWRFNFMRNYVLNFAFLPNVPRCSQSFAFSLRVSGFSWSMMMYHLCDPISLVHVSLKTGWSRDKTPRHQDSWRFRRFRLLHAIVPVYKFTGTVCAGWDNRLRSSEIAEAGRGNTLWSSTKDFDFDL